MTAVPEPTDALTPEFVDSLAETILRAMYPNVAIRLTPRDREAARAAYAAMVEHLGLVEERERGRCEIDLHHHEGRDCEPGPGQRRLVSKWEET